MNCKYDGCLYVSICRLKNEAEHCGLHKMNDKLMEKKKKEIKNKNYIRLEVIIGKRKCRV